MDINNALKMLCDKYSVNKNVEIVGATATVDGKALPLLPWRAERRFVEFKNLVTGDFVKGISTMRVCHIDSKDKDLFEILYREIDICEWTLSSKICEIFAIKNDNALNVIAKTDKGYICTFELATTLNDDAEVIDKHEIIAEKGVVCDRTVDTQVPQSSIYVFGSEGNTKYTDVDAELFGLNINDCAKVRFAFDIAKNNIDTTTDDEHICLVVNGAKKSTETMENIIL